jgi:HTH-type transcriptional regulator, competence development regulator
MKDGESGNLGDRLRRIRETKGWSLRDVEAKSGISSGHLSLIESGRVLQPSPSVLHRLADAYVVSYEDLMIVAGYLKPSDKAAQRGARARIALSTLRELNDDELSQVERYIQFLRQGRKT